MAATQRAVKFSELCGFFDKQIEATRIADAHRYTLYGGSRGPGKSRWLRWYGIRRLMNWAAQGHKGVRLGLFCEDYPSLKERQIVKIEREFPAQLGELKETKADGLGFHLRPAYGGGVLALRNLDDPSKYQSAEFAGLLIDELTKNKESVFDELRGSLRWPGLTDTFFAAASNPNGIGQKWVRSYFVEKQLPENLKGREAQFAFIPASPRDNPHLDASYWEMLDTLHDTLRRAWRDGDWYVTFDGIVFSDFGAENLTDDEPDWDKPIELAMDDGYVDPRATLFIQRTGTQILVFDEMYHSKHLEETCVNEILEKCGKWFGWKDADKKVPNKRPELAVISPEAVALRQHLRKADIAVRSQPHKIVEGLKIVRRLIKDGQGYRTLKVHKRCQKLIWEFTDGYRYPPEGSKTDEETPVDADNHASDGFRYWAWLRASR